MSTNNYLPVSSVPLTNAEQKLLASQNLRKRIYDSWIQGEPIDINDISPNEVLQRMIRQQVPVDGLGMVSPLEKIALNLVQLAIEGDKWAMEKVWLEAQHDGVVKSEVAFRTLSPAAKHILQLAGVIDESGAIIELKPTEYEMLDLSDS